MRINESALPSCLSTMKSQVDRGVLTLGSFSGVATTAEIKSRLIELGYSEASNWPLASRFAADGRVVGKKGAYQLSSRGLKWLDEHVSALPQASHDVRGDLREHLETILDEDVKRVLQEAVTALESRLFRSAVVMSWLAAVFVLQKCVFDNHRREFDSLVKAKKPDWRSLRRLDDFGQLREGEFLDRLTDLSIIGKNVKNELKGCLDRRNSCGHPNSYMLGESTAAHHLDTLILNVFKRFS